ncbi:c-type cytochrome [Azospirillum canadense]|uniref:c-type cytochrome n=1 Tax=Azospirillum canadense TaxID=403962 RepID=UPI002225E4FF|nr:c-type cytochrome [Azospirillum canadense]MCW2238908.1 cytochrome c oxidase cbb3-type subunit 3 [Azospirillum canadense]
MSSPCRRSVSLAVLAVLALAACDREEREPRGAPVGESGPQAIAQGSLYAGEPSPPDPRRQEYEGNAYHLAQGKQLYVWFNCNGCHSNGGGDIGPPLMDDTWIYGDSLENIFATIVQGRPNGMPSFRNKIPETQIWEIAAYVRSMSGQTPTAASPGRNDSLNAKPAEQRAPKAEPKQSNPGGPQVEGRQ